MGNATRGSRRRAYGHVTFAQNSATQPEMDFFLKLIELT